MSQCSKERVSNPVSKYLLIFATGILLLCFSIGASAQDDPRKTPPPPPPHPKPKSLKEVVSKIKSWNPFKKKDKGSDNSATENTTASAGIDKKSDPVPPPPDPKPQPDAVKPKTKHTTHISSSSFLFFFSFLSSSVFFFFF